MCDGSIAVTHPNAAKLVAYRENGKIVVDGKEIDEEAFLHNVEKGNPSILDEVKQILDLGTNPFNVTQGSRKRVICVKEHTNCNGEKCYIVWLSNVYGITRKEYNSEYITSNIWIGYNDIATTEPELSNNIAYLDNNQVVIGSERMDREDFLNIVKAGNPKILDSVIETLDSGVNINNITANSHKKIVCCIDVEREEGKTIKVVWVSTVYGAKRNGCTYLSRSPRDIWIGYNDLATTHPRLALQWNYDKNYPLTPKDVSYGMREKVWWEIDFYDEITKQTYHYEWKASPNKRTAMGTGCPNINSSKMELAAYNILNKNNIEFEVEQRFEDCKCKRQLRFDIYIPQLKIAIELDGIQHFKPIDFFGGKEYYKNIKKRDQIKNKYCKSHNISLLRIPYIYDSEENIKEMEEMIIDFLKDRNIHNDIIEFYNNQDNKSYVTAYAA